MTTAPRLSIDAHTLLSCIPLFSEIEAHHLAQLGSASKIIELPGHRSLFSVGQTILEAHYLVSGGIKRFVVFPDGEQCVLEIVRPGRIFALSELFCADAASVYASFAETLEPTVILSVPIELLRQIVQESSTLSGRLLGVMAQEQYTLEFDAVRQRSLPVVQRVLDYLLSLSNGKRKSAGETTVQLGASKYLIAAKLGIAPETLSRTLRQLSEEGYIVVDKRQVHIQNAAVSVKHRNEPPINASSQKHPHLEKSFSEAARTPAALVNLCGRHRMLSQRMASAWSLIARGNAVAPTKVSLRKFRLQFERNLKQVRSFAAPESVNIHLRLVEALWTQFKGALSNTAPELSHAEAIFHTSEALLEACDQLTLAAAHYANSNDASMVNIAGRNRMLCARIAKLFQFADWNIQRETMLSLIAVSRQEFEGNLAKLSEMHSKLAQLQAQLRIDKAQWNSFLVILDEGLRQTSGHNHPLRVLAGSEALLRHIDTTVKIYERIAG